MKRLVQLVAGMGLVGMMAVSGSGMAAQDAGTTQMLVQSVYCPDETGFASASCTPASGVAASAQLVGGGDLGSCVTEMGIIRDSSVGYCYIEVPYDTEVLVTQDDATLSEGYVSTNNPQQVIVRAQGDETPDYVPATVFINAWVDDAPDPAPVEEAEEVAKPPASNLPRTGSGPSAGETQVALLTATGAGLAAAALGVTARRFEAHNR